MTQTSSVVSMEPSYSRQMTHFVRLFLYTYPAQPTKNQETGEGDYMRELKRDKELLGEIADICEAEISSFAGQLPESFGIPYLGQTENQKLRSQLKAKILASQKVAEKSKALYEQDVNGAVAREAVSSPEVDEERISRQVVQNNFKSHLEMIAEQVSFYVSEAANYFSQRADEKGKLAFKVRYRD